MFKLVLTLSAFYLAVIGLALMFAPLQFGIGAVPHDASPAKRASSRRCFSSSICCSRRRSSSSE